MQRPQIEHEVLSFERLPLPQDFDAFRSLYSLLERIIESDASARWDSADLHTIRAATEYLKSGATLSPDHYWLFPQRTRMKALLKRMAAQPEWRELADALYINVAPPNPLSTDSEINDALAVFEKIVSQSIRARRNGKGCPYRATWTLETKDIVRSLIFVAERHPERMSSEQMKRYDASSQDLALILTWGTVELLLLAEAIDADIHDGFRDRLQDEMDEYVRSGKYKMEADARLRRQTSAAQ